MKSCLRPLLAALVVGLALIPTIAFGAGMNTDAAVDRLDQLVSLTADQRIQAAKILADEIDALQAFPSLEDRTIKGMPIRQHAQAQIRALLTPIQQKIYDTTPQRRGGGALQDINAAVERLDKLVNLTGDQKVQATDVFTMQNNSLQAFSSLEERMNKGMPIRQHARAQIRALLTPEQQKIYDITPLRLGGGTLQDINAAVERLDQLVNLTTDQTVQAAAIFIMQNDAVEALPTVEDRIMKGMDIRQDTRAQIRAILTPAQLKIYDTSPQRLGGDAMQDPAGIASRIDKVVTLTDDQIAPVSAIYQKEIDALQALSAGGRANGQAAAIQKSAQAQVRALLTPEQQQKFDANPNGSEDLEERAFVSVFLQTAPAVIARVGAVTRVVQTGYLVHVTGIDAGLKAMKGNYVFYVQGSADAAKFKVYWEKSPFAPIKIVKIEDFVGGTIPP